MGLTVLPLRNPEKTQRGEFGYSRNIERFLYSYLYVYCMTKDSSIGIQDASVPHYKQTTIRVDEKTPQDIKEIMKDLEMTKLSEVWRYILRLGIQEYWYERGKGKVMRKRQTVK